MLPLMRRGPSMRVFMSNAGRPLIALLTNSLSSLGNLVLAIVVARGSSVTEFGEFGIAFSVYALVVGLSRATVSDMALTQPSQGLSQIYVRRAGGIGCLCGLAVVVAALASDSQYLLLVGVALPGLSVYEHLKATLLALGEARGALFQELLWTLGTVGAVFVVSLTGSRALAVFAAWSLLGALIGCSHALLRGHRFGLGWRAGKAERRNMAGFGMQYLTGSGVAQVMPAVLAAVAGSAVVGALRAGGTLVSPLTLILSTAKGFLITRLSRSHGQAATGASLRPAVLSMSLLVAVLGPLGLMVTLTPDYLGEALLGQSWEFAKPLMPALVGELIFSAIVAVAGAGHRVFGAGARGLFLEASIAPIRVALIVWAGYRWGAIGAALAMMAIAIVGVVLWWTSYASLVKNVDRDASVDLSQLARQRVGVRPRFSAQSSGDAE
jgi:O-antigen/teichoic acid export membrane protein